MILSVIVCLFFGGAISASAYLRIDNLENGSLGSLGLSLYLRAALYQSTRRLFIGESGCIYLDIEESAPDCRTCRQRAHAGIAH